MRKRPTFAVFIFLFVSSPWLPQSVQGQEWVRDMFEETSHDFGTVPRGAKAEFEFVFTNKYQEDLHIKQVRSSCGCTTPSVRGNKLDIKTYEQGAIVCEFNTRSFVGAKAAVVTVVFDRPFHGEIQLMVKGNIRSDILTEPGEIQFGELDRGSEKATTVMVSYAGPNKWEIVDVRSVNQHLGVKLLDRKVVNGRVQYEMQVRLKDSAPSGDFSDQIVLVTNDKEYNLVTVPVRGNVLAPLVMPVSVDLGTIKAGQKVQTRMIIRSSQDFEVTKVECEDKRLAFAMPQGEAKKFHTIPITFEATDVGAFRKLVSVHTSLAEENVATTYVTGNIVP